MFVESQVGGKTGECWLGEVQWQPQECGVQPHEPPLDSLALEEAVEAPLPVCAAKVENCTVDRRLPHFGHSGWPFFAVTMRS